MCYIYIYTCIYISMYVCTCNVISNVCAHLSLSLYIYIYTCIGLYAYIYIYIYIYTHNYDIMYDTRVSPPLKRPASGGPRHGRRRWHEDTQLNAGNFASHGFDISLSELLRKFCRDCHFPL